MAAVTLLGTHTFTTSNTSPKTVTATPAVGDLIVIVTAHTTNTSSTAPTDDNSSGTYSQIGSSAVKASSADTLQFWVRNSLIGSASSTVFTHAPGSNDGGGLAVLKITGMSRTGSSAIRQSAKQDNQLAATTPAPAFGAAALTANPIITAVFNASNPANTTVPTSYTSRVNDGFATPVTGLRIASIDSGVTASTITWGGTSATAYASFAVELDASSGTTGRVLLLGVG